MNNKDLGNLKYLLEKYREVANMKYEYTLSERIDYVLIHIEEDLK